jgi:hypothetical protein
MEVGGETVAGQYQVSHAGGPTCQLTVWFHGAAATEEIAAHGRDYEEFCASRTLERLARERVAG